MSSNKNIVALPSTPDPMPSKGKRFLLSSSPASNLYTSKRTRLTAFDTSSPCNASDIVFSIAATRKPRRTEESNGLTPVSGSGVNSSDAISPIANEDSSIWYMQQDSEASDTGLDKQAKEPLPEILHILLQRGPDHGIGDSVLPTIIYVNRDTGAIYQHVVDRELFFISRDISGVDPENTLWLQTNLYISELRDTLEQITSDSSEVDFPILHRHGDHMVITGDDLASEEHAPFSLKESIKREWNILKASFGEFNDIQVEQKALIDKAFYLLCRYQLAVASRDLVDAIKINSLLDPLRDALNELALTEYLIRELFYRDRRAQFLTAFSIS